MSSYSRRNFIRNAALSGAGAGTVLNSLASNIHDRQKITVSGYIKEDSDKVLPTAVQREWMNLQFGMFIHFGINTYYDKEWSDGTLEPKAFNPEKLNTDQWCRTARDAGMKYIVLITKHHDGFCLWPSKYTKYTVAASPWKGDLIAEVANSAAKYGSQSSAELRTNGKRGTSS